MTDAREAPITVLYVAGVSRCGSTILGKVDLGWALLEQRIAHARSPTLPGSRPKLGHSAGSISGNASNSRSTSFA